MKSLSGLLEPVQKSIPHQWTELGTKLLAELRANVDVYLKGGEGVDESDGSGVARDDKLNAVAIEAPWGIVSRLCELPRAWGLVVRGQEEDHEGAEHPTARTLGEADQERGNVGGGRDPEIGHLSGVQPLQKAGHEVGRLVENGQDQECFKKLDYFLVGEEAGNAVSFERFEAFDGHNAVVSHLSPVSFESFLAF